MNDSFSLLKIVSTIALDEIYNFADQSHVKVSFEVPEYTADADAIGTMRLLEAMRMAEIEKSCRFSRHPHWSFMGRCRKCRKARRRCFTNIPRML